MPSGVSGEVPYQRVPLVLRSNPAASRPRRRMRLVHDDEVRGIVQEPLPVPVRLDEIDAGHQVTIVLVQGDIASRETTLQSSDAGRLDDCCIDVELRSQLLLPLLAQVGGAEDADPPHNAPVQHLAGDHGCFDGLPHANVVRNQAGAPGRAAAP